MSKPEKRELLKTDRGGCFLSLIVSGYHVITISKSFVCSKRPISGFRRSVIPKQRVRLHLEHKN